MLLARTSILLPLSTLDPCRRSFFPPSHLSESHRSKHRPQHRLAFLSAASQFRLPYASIQLRPLDKSSHGRK